MQKFLFIASERFYKTDNRDKKKSFSPLILLIYFSFQKKALNYLQITVKIHVGCHLGIKKSLSSASRTHNVIINKFSYRRFIVFHQ